MPYDPSLAAAALELTQEAAKIAVEARKSLEVQLKPDGSLVTNGDKAVEAWLLPQLVDLTPGAGFWGEEGSFLSVTDEGFWLLDPIDGTSNYRYGQALWGVTAAFMKGDEIQLGTIVMPELGLSMVTYKGGGAHLNGSPIRPIPPGKIERFELMGHGTTKHLDTYGDIGKGRHLGAFVAEGLYVCIQQLRAMTTSSVKLYDAAAGILAVQELGGVARMVNGDDFVPANWTRDVRCPPIYLGPADSNFPFDRA